MRAVEHPVGVERHAVAGRRSDSNSSVSAPAPMPSRSRIQLLQHARLQVAGVDAVAELGDAREQRALALDRLGSVRPRAGQRMAAARLGEAAQQRSRRSPRGRARGTRRRALAQARRCARAARRGAALRASTLTATRSWPRVGEEVDHLQQQRRRQVVDAVVAAVLQHVQRDALARARQAADQDELHRAELARLSASACFWRARNSAVESMPRSLQDVVAHRRLDQHREVAPGGDRDDHLAHRDAEDVLGELGERQALGRVARRPARLLEVRDQAAASSSAAPRSRRRWCGC